MASRLGQHLLRAKSMVGNFGLFICPLFQLFVFCCCFFFLSAFWLPHHQLLAVIEQTVSLTQCLSLHLGYQLSAQSWTGGGGCLHLTEWPVSFHRNAIIPQIAENTLPRLKPSFSKMWKCRKYPKQVERDIVVAFRLAKYLIGCNI